MAEGGPSHAGSLNARIAESINRYRASLDDPAGVRAQRDVWEGLTHDETRQTLAFRGVDFTQRDIETLLRRGIAPRSRAVRDCAYVIGFASAVVWTHSQPRSTTPMPRDIRTLHELSGGAVDRLWGHFVPLPPSSAVAAARAVRDVAQPCPTVESLGRAEARCYAAVGGDVPLTRLVVNLALARAGCPPIVVSTRDAATYARLIGDGKPERQDWLGAFLARRLLDTVHRFAFGDSSVGLASLTALASERVSADALRVAATRGRLRAQKGADGVWRSNRAWVENYLAARYVRTRTRSA